MKLVLVAVGQRQPAWADAAFEDLAKRFPPECRLEMKLVKAEPRSSGKPVDALMAAEAARIEAMIPRASRRVILDERGERRSTVQLADRLRFWMGDGRDVAFV
ncbi:MAG: 23S rRNA (pseudouridine(1915)-N(3))-methyltransferase RlmH, partial [Aquincola sp.]|nr:23S rRNA (pseudouridine(1915)-N(3))-methyltransferase RlmH [Aquincola sp.]